MKKTLKYVTAHELVGLQTKINRMLRTGDMSFEQLKYFANLDYDGRAKLLANLSVDIPSFSENLIIGGKNYREIISEIEKTHDISREKCMLEHERFTTLPKIKKIRTSIITPRLLGFSSSHPTSFDNWINILKQHPSYDICPSEAGPHGYLSYKNNGTEEMRIHVAMETIPGDGGSPSVFCIGHDKKGKWFNSRWFHSDRELGLDDLWLVQPMGHKFA